MLPNERNQQVLKIIESLEKPHSSGTSAFPEDEDVRTFAQTLLDHPPFEPSQQQNQRLQARLQAIASQASPDRIRRKNQIDQIRFAARSLIVTAILSGLTILVILLFRQNALSPTPLPVSTIASTTAPNRTPTPDAPILVPTYLRVVPDTCALDSANTFLEEEMYFNSIPESFVGGGSVESGDFRFDLWLTCDQRFNSDLSSGSDDFSEINGLGILVGWRYQGSAQEGTLWDYAGFEPFISKQSGSSPTSAGMASFVDRGIHISNDIIPDFTKQDTRLRYVYFTELPSGERNGAALTFTLLREAEGYRPIQIEVKLLSPAELAGIENQEGGAISFATRNPIDEFPQMAAIREQLQDWESSILDHAGWLYIKNAVTDGGSNWLYGGVSETIEEGWYLLDDSRLIMQSINQTTTLDGRVLQQSIYNQGRGWNLTTGSSYDYPPVTMRLIDDLIESLTSQARTGEDWQPLETSWQGQLAWVFTNRDNFDTPTNVDQTDQVLAVESRDYIDPHTGRRLGDEIILYTVDGQETLGRRQIPLLMEQVDSPPADILALLDQGSAIYNPPLPAATPAPKNFDPSKAELSLVTIPGDDFDQPSFWLGDILADGYLLGRLNFGSVPGGRCQRSKDGNHIGILYESKSVTGNYTAEVQWFNLADLSTIKHPAPQVNVHGLFIAWAPEDPVFAVSGCLQDYTECGVYLVDTRSNSVRFLSPVALSIWPMIWSPDGSQLAVVDTRDDQHRFFVLDSRSGNIVYEGFFDADNWQIPADSPAANWGVRIPHNSGEEGGCFKVSEAWHQ